MDEETPHVGQQLAPFVSATSEHVRPNVKWQEQLKSERERVRHSLISGNNGYEDNMLDLNAVENAVITVLDPNNHNTNEFQNHGPMLPVVPVTTQFPSKKSVADEFTLKREQRAAFMIITSNLDGDSQCRTGNYFCEIDTEQLKHQTLLGPNNGQLIMCIPGCGGTGKSQLIRALSKYFFITKRMQNMRKLAPTGIAAAEIDGMTIHSFLGEQRHSGKPRTIKPGDSKLERESGIMLNIF